MPDYVRCIADNYGVADGAEATTSWCGRAIHRTDKSFLDIDHAAMNGRSGGFLIACPRCTAAIIAGLKNGSGD